MITGIEHPPVGSGERTVKRPARFIKSVGLLSFGTLAGQASMLIVSPVLTRVYSPAEIGTYGVYVTLVAIGLVIASLKYDLCIPVVPSEEDAVLVTNACIGIAVLAALGVGLSGYFAGGSLVKWTGIAEASSLMWWVGLGLFGGATLQAASTLSIRRQAFGGLASARAAFGVTLAGGQVGFGVAGWTAIGLPLADALSRLLAGLLAIAALGRSFLHGLRGFSLSRVSVVLRRFWEFPVYMMPASLMNILSTQALLLWGPKLFSLAETGAFFLAYRVLFLPGSLLAQAVSQVFLGRIASEEKSDRSKSTFTVIVALLAAGTPVCFGIWLHALALFPLIFGAEWDSAGAFAFLMAPHLLLWLPATATSSVLLVNRKFREALFVNLAHLSATIAGLYWGAAHNSYFDAVAVLSGLSVILYGFGVWWFARMEGISLSRLLGAYIRHSLAMNLPFLLVQWVVSYYSAVWAGAIWVLVTPLVIGLSVRTIVNESRSAPTRTGTDE